MTGNLTDITEILQTLAIGIAVLALLLLVIRILEIFMRRLAQRHVDNTDLDIIGRQAVVTATIRPRKPGKVSCHDQTGAEFLAEASSDQMLRRGQKVMINAINGHQLRVSPLEINKVQESSPNK